MADPFDLSDSQIDLLLRYIAGQVTSAEAEEVGRWIAMRPEHARMLATLEQGFAIQASGTEVVREVSNADLVWNHLAARLPEESVGEPRPLVLHRDAPGDASVAVGRSPLPAARTWLRAAAVLFAVGAGFGVWRIATPRVSAFLADQRATSGYREYVTRASERASFTLADGTQVMLGVASRLRVPHDYGQTRREVALDGEAYFEVRHDAERRFLVHSTHGITEDLGTRFDVRDYAGDTAAQVVVAEGKVALQAKYTATPVKPMLLTAGQLGHASASGTVTVRDGADVDQHLAWLEGRLVLRNTSLRDALPQLSRWYDLDFQLGDSTLATTGITATLTSQPIASALDLLAVTLDMRIERKGRIVTLYRHTVRRTP